MKRGFTTTLLHSDRLGGPEHGSLHKPIHTSVAYGYESAESLAAVFQGRAQGYAYARQGNPTVAALEHMVTQLEDGVGSIAFGTGMAAIHALFATLLRKGDHVVASKFLFGNTASQLGTLERLGIEASFVDATDVAAVAAALRPTTRLVFVETIANPVTQVSDLAGIGALCRERELLYVVDNTMTSAYLFRPKSVGAGLVVNALTKYIGGHGDALGGSLTDTGVFDWTGDPSIYDAYKSGPADRWALVHMRKKGLRDFGGALDADAAHRLAIGVETLALRMTRAANNALQLATLLEGHAAVERAYDPGLASHAQHARAGALFRLPGALLSFELKAGHDVFAVLNRLRIGILSSKLGDNRTLVIPVAHTIFYELGAERRASMGIADSLVRVSVGIEDPEDLLSDFDAALSGA